MVIEILENKKRAPRSALFYFFQNQRFLFLNGYFADGTFVISNKFQVIHAIF